MVAPGHCSPSRKVVSKMTTRSFSDWAWVVMDRSFKFAPAAWVLALVGSVARSTP